MTDAELAYFAIPDPAVPGRMTYWRRVDGDIRRWPPKAKHGPPVDRDQVPTKPAEREAWVANWHREVAGPWWAAVRAAIDADPTAAAARFAAFATRCASCSRRLTDAESKATGAGPECRRSLPDWVLADLARQVVEMHARSVAADRP